MKYFIAIALIATVASAAIVRPTQVTGELAQIQEILNAINNPSTDPATAVLLEQLLLETLGVNAEPESIAVGPALVDVPAGDGGALSPIETAPAIVPPAESTPAGNTPLVQIILNINQVAESGAEAGSSVVSGPAVIPDTVSVVETAPDTVSVVETAPDTVSVVETAPETVSVVESAPETVSVVETAPETVVVVDNAPVVQPALPSPVVILPGILN